MQSRLLFFLLLALGAASAQNGGATQEIPLRRCDRLLLIDVSVSSHTYHFLVDTGATSIALSSEAARRMGLNYTSGARVPVRTASAQMTGYKISLDSVRVGDITLNNVEALVLEGRYPEEALLGMSFLSRTQMKRDGDTLTLVRRY